VDGFPSTAADSGEGIGAETVPIRPVRAPEVGS